MARALVVSVRLHDSRYHGLPEWPPSPARLFQALMAGAAVGPVSSGDRSTLIWLESLGAPTIASPRALTGQGLTSFVPNNDLDAVRGDPGRVSEIRAGKRIRPRLLDGQSPLIYVWHFDRDDEPHAHAMCEMATRVYQFGRGVDMAWASADVVDIEELEEELATHQGLVYRPSGGESGVALRCPTQGSLASLEARFIANSQRFRSEAHGTKMRHLYSGPPKPHFVDTWYESPPSRQLYELRQSSPDAPFAQWPLVQVCGLVELVRDLAADRLRRALVHRTHDVDRFIVGHSADGTLPIPAALRVRIAPLPSIGHRHVDPSIRRVMVEVPAGCPLRPGDVHWAFSGLVLVDRDTGEDLDIVLTPAADDGMLAHYGVQDGKSHRMWRTVTPAVLPESAKRRRIEPTRITEETKGGHERAREEVRGAAAVAQAIRHANIRARPGVILVQREPFEINGARVEPFAHGTRFSKERLWHTEIVFDAPVSGPLVVGDGRFLGLGIMAPAPSSQSMHVWTPASGLDERAEPLDVTRALRRAVMAMVQDVIGARTELPRFFSGHERDGSPDRTLHRHLTFAFDPTTSRLLILAPHVICRRSPTDDEIRHLQTLDEALVGFRDLRAGRAGRLTLRAISVDAEDSLLGPSRVWESITPYEVTRHAKRVSAAESFCADVSAECDRIGLPRPRVTPRELRGVPGVGLVGSARLTFEVAVRGPILLGKSSHLGGGLFRGDASRRPRNDD